MFSHCRNPCTSCYHVPNRKNFHSRNIQHSLPLFRGGLSNCYQVIALERVPSLHATNGFLKHVGYAIDRKLWFSHYMLFQLIFLWKPE